MSPLTHCSTETLYHCIMYYSHRYQCYQYERGQGYQWSAGKEGEVLLTLFEVYAVVVLNFLHLLQFGPLHACHLLHIELAPSVITVEVHF